MLKSPPPSDVNGESSSASAAASSQSQPQQQQQQQQQPDKKGAMTPLERQREEALREAQQVMESMGTNQLDHFNLLGVVANPRGSQHGGGASASATTPTSTMHGQSSVSSSMHSGNAHYNSSQSDNNSFLFSDTYNTFESTLSSVTEQIENLNHVFEDWSRQYLNDYYYQDAADSVPESQLPELPPELLQLDMSTLQKYLQESGVLAQSYQRNAQQQALKKKRQEELQLQIDTATLSNNNNNNNNTHSSLASSAPPSPASPSTRDALSDIPEIFFQQDFDLTDPKTFRQLLLNDGGGGLGGTGSGTSHSSNTATTSMASLQEPTNDLFQIPPPDHFTGYLDTIEVALLEQVREKSEAFFQETNRFAQLKEWVGELLVDVQRIRLLLDGQAKAIQSWQQVPQWDRTRKQLLKLEAILEGSNEVLRCKQCIGGLLSAKDDLGAVEQIQYARRLLAGVAEEEDDDEVEERAIDTTAATEQPNEPQHNNNALAVVEKEAPVELGRLQALRTVGEQLNQYESLVVTSLTEEVVEIFLEWNTSTLASMYGFSTTNGGMLSSRAQSQNEVERRTLNIVASLQMCHALGHMTQFYGTRLHDMVRMTVRTTVGEFASDAAVSARGGNTPGTSVSVNVTAMSLERFIDCLDMLFEQILALLTSASGVDEFCQKEGLTLRDENKSNSNGGNSSANGASSNISKKSNNSNGDANGGHAPLSSSQPDTAIRPIVGSAAELSSKSIAELLRLRKEVHSLVSLDEMRRIWDTCTKFAEEVEKLSGHKCVAVRSMLLTQAKAFVERKHDSNMTSLAAALDSERWTQCEVSSERQIALTNLCSGRAGYSTGRLRRSTSTDESTAVVKKSPEAEVEGIRYKVVWSCLLLVEMIMTNIEAAVLFHSLASNVVGKICELLRLFNSRATQLVLGAGAIHSAARLKSINAKHLSLVTQCLGMTIALLPHVRAALMSQLPPKQHTLLTDLDKIKKEYADHNEKVLNKFVTIIGGIVEHGLAKHIGGTDFDARAKDPALEPTENGVACCVFLEGVLTNTRKMHQVLSALLPPEHLQDVFSRIFAFIDQKIPALLITAAENGNKTATPQKAPSTPFRFPSTNNGKKRLLDEVDSVTKSLNALDGVYPWEFSAVSVLAKTLEYEFSADIEKMEDIVPAEEPDAENTDGGPVEEPTTKNTDGGPAKEPTTENTDGGSDENEATPTKDENGEAPVDPAAENPGGTKAEQDPMENQTNQGSTSTGDENKETNVTTPVSESSSDP